MSITLEWDNEDKTILRWDFNERWNTEQFRQTFQIGATLINGVAHSVYGLGIMYGTPPPKLRGIGDSLIAVWPDNLQILVLVGATGLMKDALTRLVRHDRADRNGVPRVMFVDALPEAYEAITFLHLKEVYTRA